MDRIQKTETTYVKTLPTVGRSVFSLMNFNIGDHIESNVVLPVNIQNIKNSELSDYLMEWTDEHDCIALGNIQLINHSDTPNCIIHDDIANTIKSIYAIKKISAGEQLTTKYKCELWFKPIPI